MSDADESDLAALRRLLDASTLRHLRSVMNRKAGLESAPKEGHAARREGMEDGLRIAQAKLADAMVARWNRAVAEAPPSETERASRRIPHALPDD